MPKRSSKKMVSLAAVVCAIRSLPGSGASRTTRKLQSKPRTVSTSDKAADTAGAIILNAAPFSDSIGSVVA